MATADHTYDSKFLF